MNEHPGSRPDLTDETDGVVSTPISMVKKIGNDGYGHGCEGEVRGYVQHRSLWWNTTSGNTSTNGVISGNMVFDKSMGEPMGESSHLSLTHIPGFTVSPWYDDKFNGWRKKQWDNNQSDPDADSHSLRGVKTSPSTITAAILNLHYTTTGPPLQCVNQ